MSAHSHVTRIHMMERSKNPPKIIPSYHGSQSILSGGPDIADSVISDGSNIPPGSVLSTGSRGMNPRELKQQNIYRSKSQEVFLGLDDTSFRASNSMLSHTYAPSMKSLKSGGGMGPRATSRTSLASMSRSLGASKASVASIKSTIQQEYHDIKVKRKLNAPWFGVARKPFLISIMLFIIAFIFLVIGVTVLFLRGFWNVFLSHDTGEIIGPLFIALAMLTTAFAIKFITDAYRLGGIERRNIKFRADNSNMVEVTKGPAKPRANEVLITGTNTKQAVSRKLMTSRGDLREV